MKTIHSLHHPRLGLITYTVEKSLEFGLPCARLASSDNISDEDLDAAVQAAYDANERDLLVLTPEVASKPTPPAKPDASEVKPRAGMMNVSACEAVTENLAGFIEHLQYQIVDYTTKNLPNLRPDRLEIEEGRKYIKIVRTNWAGSGKSVYGFICKSTGNLLKAASWATPALNFARGKIQEKSSWKCCSVYSIQ